MKRMNELAIGESGTVISIGIQGHLRRRLLDLGLVVGTCVKRLGTSPGGDPSAYLIRGAVIAIRAKDCSEIFVE